jgi:amino acid transporter
MHERLAMMQTVVGLAFFVPAVLIAVTNFYLTFLRTPLHRWRGRDVRPDSGIPAVGTGFLVLALMFLYWSPLIRWGTLVVAVVDTGGIPWVFVTVLWVAMRRRQGRGDSDVGFPGSSSVRHRGQLGEGPPPEDREGEEHD